jgi:hypothetical protein
MPELDASVNAVALESMTLQNEGWQRDDSFAAPAAICEVSDLHPPRFASDVVGIPAAYPVTSRAIAFRTENRPDVGFGR